MAHLQQLLVCVECDKVQCTLSSLLVIICMEAKYFKHFDMYLFFTFTFWVNFFIIIESHSKSLVCIYIMEKCGMI
jgi:hypothetical protein